MKPIFYGLAFTTASIKFNKKNYIVKTHFWSAFQGIRIKSGKAKGRRIHVKDFTENLPTSLFFLITCAIIIISFFFFFFFLREGSGGEFIMLLSLFCGGRHKQHKCPEQNDVN